MRAPGGPLPSSGETPIACSLSGEAMSDRQAEVGALFREALLWVDREGAALRLRLPDSREVAERIGRLVALERECCPFLEIEVSDAAGGLEVRIHGPAGAEDVIDAFAGVAAGSLRA